jgi:hypothetical protein
MRGNLIPRSPDAVKVTLHLESGQEEEELEAVPSEPTSSTPAGTAGPGKGGPG